jgi:D-alanyl-D-alanine dipeptidase
MIWQQVPIAECHDPLIEAQGRGIFSAPAYLERGYSAALEAIQLRSPLVDRLKVAAQALPDDLTLVLWDGWRPLELQAELFEQYRRELSDQYQGPELEAETRKFVSPASVDPPSPHLTGGAIDLTLGDSQGRPLEMGGEYDELGPRSASWFYERAPGQDGLYRQRRRLLRRVMAEVGFSNYCHEWWHFDFGNQFHHARVGGVARYGAIAVPEAPAT